MEEIDKTMKIIIDGDVIRTEQDFHLTLSSELKIGNFYGENLHALWDVLSSSVERPVTLTWKKSGKSRQVLGADFDTIVDVLRRVKMQDEKFEWPDKFSFVLE